MRYVASWTPSAWRNPYLIGSPAEHAKQFRARFECDHMRGHRIPFRANYSTKCRCPGM